MVIAIVIVILGAVAIPNLPVATYPEVVPPVVQITANLPRRQRAGSRTDRRAADRAAARRPRRHALLLLAQLERRRADDRRHLRPRHQRRHRDGADAEQASTSRCRRCRRKCSARASPSRRSRPRSCWASRSRRPTTATTRSSSTTSSPSTCSIGSAALPGVGEARLASRQDYGMRVWVESGEDGDARPHRHRSSAAAIQAQNRQNPAGALGQPPVAVRHRLPVSGQRRRPPGRAAAVRGHRPAGAARRLAPARPRRRRASSSARRTTRTSAALQREAGRRRHRLPVARRQRRRDRRPRARASSTTPKQRFPAGHRLPRRLTTPRRFVHDRRSPTSS